MNTLSCIIVEDQPPAQRILKKYIEDIPGLELIQTFADAIHAIEFVNRNSVDIIFLDVHLPKLSGMDFLKAVNPSAKVIMTTAFSNYALEGYEYNVIDYLLKPFSFERFVKAVTKATALIDRSNHPLPLNESKDDNRKEDDALFIKSGTDLVQVHLSEILFIKSDGDYTLLHFANKKLLVSQPLRYWVEMLDDTRFAQTHKSYIVNLNKVSKVAGGRVVVQNIEIPIGRTFKEGVLSRIKIV